MKKKTLVFHRVVNIVEKEENAGYHNVFKRFLSQRRQETSLWCKELKSKDREIESIHLVDVMGDQRNFSIDVLFVRRKVKENLSFCFSKNIDLREVS